MENKKNLDAMSKEEIKEVIDNYDNIAMLFVNSLVDDGKIPDNKDAKSQLQEIFLNQMIKSKYGE